MKKKKQIAENHSHNFWFVSENLKATVAILSNLSARIYAYSGDHIKAPDLVLLIEQLLTNIEALKEAAMAISNFSPAITRDILSATVGLKRDMCNYISELRRCSNRREVDIKIDSTEYVYERVSNNIKTTIRKYRNMLKDLIDKVEAESVLKNTNKPHEKDGQSGGGKVCDENKSAKEKQEGALEPKPPEILQKLLWLKQHGKKYWKLILLAILILLGGYILPKFGLFGKISTLIKAIHF